MALGIWVDESDRSNRPWTAVSFDSIDSYSVLMSRGRIGTGRYPLEELRNDDEVGRVLIEPSK
jgi:hypothetical protein